MAVDPIAQTGRLPRLMGVPAALEEEMRRWVLDVYGVRASLLGYADRRGRIRVQVLTPQLVTPDELAEDVDYPCPGCAACECSECQPKLVILLDAENVRSLADLNRERALQCMT